MLQAEPSSGELHLTAAVSTDSDGDGLALILRDPQLNVLAHHHFVGPASCEVRALTIAAVIAAWTGDLRSATAPAPVPSLMQPPPPRLDYEVGGEFLASVAGRSFAPGGLAYGLLTKHRQRWAGRFAIIGTGSRSFALGEGNVAWTRLAVSVGAVVRFFPRRFYLDIQADLLNGLLRTEGSGFSANGVAWAFDPGLSIGVRGGIRFRTGSASFGVSAFGWPREQRVRVAYLSEQPTVPRFDIVLSAGFAFGTFQAAR